MTLETLKEEREVSEPMETLFEIDVEAKTVKAVGIPLDTDLDDLKIIINGVDVNRTMRISSLKIVKVL